MIDLATVAAVVAVAAAALAVGLRDVRASAVALAVAAAVAPLAVTPIPGALPLAARFAGALLGADLLLVTARTRGIRERGPAVGLPAVGLAAVAAFLAGLWIAPVAPLQVSALATGQAAGVALIALALLPLTDRDPLRIGIGAALACVGLALLRETWVGTAPALEDLAIAVLIAAILGAAGLMASPDAEAVAEPSLETAAHDTSLPGLRRAPLALRPARPAASTLEGEPGWALEPADDEPRPAAKPVPKLPPRYAGAPADLRRRRSPRERGERE
jgi:hypothetical protein